MFKLKQSAFIPILLTAVLLHLLSVSASADLLLGPAEYVEANSNIIHVPGYSVPSFTFWDGDSLKDLIIGEGGGGFSEGKVRVYLNVGTAADPIFGTFSYAQSEGSNLICPGSG